MKNKNSDNALIKLLLILAHADEIYHENEEKLIKEICKVRNIDSSEYGKILKEVLDEKNDYKSICLRVLKEIKITDMVKKDLEILKF